MNDKTYRVRWGCRGFCDAAEFAVAADAFEFAVRKQREDGVYDAVLEIDKHQNWVIRWPGGEFPFSLPPNARPPDALLLRALFIAWTGRVPGSLSVGPLL